MSEAGKGWRSYALSISVALVGALGTYSWNSVSADVKQLQTESSQRAERLASTEAQVQDMKETVQRIERKVDLLLERQAGRGEQRRSQ